MRLDIITHAAGLLLALALCLLAMLGTRGCVWELRVQSARPAATQGVR